MEHIENSEDETDEQISSSSENTTNPNEYFDRVIGHIEDIVVDDKFKTLHDTFLENNFEIFEDTEENKIEYMTIFKDYAKTFENFFVEELNKRMNDFDMVFFTECLLLQDPNEEYEMIEFFKTFLDFIKFKQMMLVYKYDKEGKYDHLKDGIIVIKMLGENESDSD